MDNIFKNYVIDGEIYVSEDDWSKMKAKHTEQFIIEEISDAIDIFNIKLPYRVITEKDVILDYLKLLNLDSEELIHSGEWYNKFDYKYHFNDSYISTSNIGNKASDYFHQIERWKCDATGYPSPQKTWDNRKFRLTLFKSLFSLKIKELNPQILRSCISLRKYIAAQFRPSAAKVIYDYFKPETTLDFSMGWGDRLLAAHTSESVKKYIGFDPNKNLHDGYTNQINFYNEINKLYSTEYELYNARAEDESIIINDKVDLIFTSPPYYDKEKYDQSYLQSYKMYKKFDDWMNNFLNKTLDIRLESLKTGGYLLINISDIYTRKKLYPICDTMNNFLSTKNYLKYYGAIGFKMPKRPKSKASKQDGVFAEPVWVWKKI